MSEGEDGVTRRGVLQGSIVAGAVLATGGLAATARATSQVTVPQYVLRRLKQLGCDVLFGVPGATCDPLFHAAHEGGELEVCTTASDLNAGYAADGYARTKGLGAVSVTYGVGTMAILSVIAGAHAERSPIVVINGGPSGKDLELEEEHGSLFSHSSGHMGVDLKLFREVTARAERVDRADDVPEVVDRVLTTALQEKRPVYLEIAKHLWWASCGAPVGELAGEGPVTPGDVPVAKDVLAKLTGGSSPLVLVGAEVARFGLQDQVQRFLTASGLPWASTLLGKGVLDESVAGFQGVYAGKRSLPACREAVEGSDALVMLGCVLGRQLRTVATTDGPGVRLKIGQGIARGPDRNTAVSLRGVVAHLAENPLPAKGSPTTLAGSFSERRAGLSSAGRDEPGMTYDEAMAEVAAAVEGADRVLMSDTSLSMYPAADVAVGKGGFLCNGVWNAIGFSVPAAIGVAKAGGRPVAVCGDGGFQMTAQALSTLARRGLPAVVLVLDNGVYGIEQWLLDPKWHGSGGAPRDYLALPRWQYAELGSAMGVGFARGAATPEALREALRGALAQNGPAIVQVAVRPHDLPAKASA